MGLEVGLHTNQSGLHASSSVASCCCRRNQVGSDRSSNVFVFLINITCVDAGVFAECVFDANRGDCFVQRSSSTCRQLVIQFGVVGQQAQRTAQWNGCCNVEAFGICTSRTGRRCVSNLLLSVITTSDLGNAQIIGCVQVGLSCLGCCGQSNRCDCISCPHRQTSSKRTISVVHTDIAHASLVCIVGAGCCSSASVGIRLSHSTCARSSLCVVLEAISKCCAETAESGSRIHQRVVATHVTSTKYAVESGTNLGAERLTRSLCGQRRGIGCTSSDLAEAAFQSQVLLTTVNTEVGAAHANSGNTFWAVGIKTCIEVVFQQERSLQTTAQVFHTFEGDLASALTVVTNEVVAHGRTTTVSHFLVLNGRIERTKDGHGRLSESASCGCQCSQGG